MLGVYDFCGHYEWTFAWLEARGGKSLVHEYWDDAINQDSQRHASARILGKGIEGMKEYWGHSLSQEGAGYFTASTESAFRLDIHECPSKGFLLANGLEQYSDYCDHCIGWIGPMMKRAGFAIDHQHNHCGQCWWEFRQPSSGGLASGIGELAGEADARLHPNWKPGEQTLDSFWRANHPEEKAKRTSSKSQRSGGAPAWERLADLPVGCGNFACGVIDGDLVVAGGVTCQDGKKAWLDDILVFTPEMREWHQIGKLPCPMAYAACGSIEDGIFLAGGGNGTNSLNLAGSLDRRFTFHKAGKLPQSSFYSGAATIGGLLYVAGGTTDPDALTTATDAFYSIHTLSGQIEQLPPLPEGKMFLPAAAAVKETFFLFAGATFDASTQKVANSKDSHSYSVAERKWTSIAPFPIKARGVAACVLDGQRILVGGGFVEDFSDACFIYDPHRDAYAPTVPLPYRGMATLVKMGDYVYCFGGEDRMRHRTALCYRIPCGALIEGS